MNLDNRVVILTGASQGIGRATVEVLARSGCKLVLAARNQQALQTQGAALSTSGHQALAVAIDMGDTAQVAALAQATVDHFGRIDVVINNAAIGVRDDILALDEAELRRVMDVNFFGPLALIQAAVPIMKRNPDGGLIVNVSSIVGRRAMPGIGGYCASKGALEKMADSLRVELAADNIRVSTVYPGVTQTRFNRNSLGGGPTESGRRMGVSPHRVAAAIARTIRTERRDVFITLFDRTFVTASMAWPWLMDQLLKGYLGRRKESAEKK